MINIKKFIKKIKQIRDHFLYISRSRHLNDKLYADIININPNVLSLIEEEIKKQCKILGYSVQYTENWLTHNYRLALTYLEILDLLSKNSITTILDLGEESLFGNILRSLLKGVKISNTHGDLRTTFGIGKNKFDLIVATEVFEHIMDIPSAYNDSFLMSGLRKTLRLCNQHLNKNGSILITTPNAASVRVIEKALQGNLPLMYEPHIREYTLPILQKELQRTSFKVIKAKSIHCITVGYNADYSNIFKLMLDAGYSTECRGDDLFIVAQKK